MEHGSTFLNGHIKTNNSILSDHNYYIKTSKLLNQHN